MRVLIDTCVVLDAIQAREPFNQVAEAIVLSSASKKIRGFISANSVADIYYISYRLTKNREESLNNIIKLLTIFEVLDVNSIDCRNATLSDIDDFEDALLVEVAIRHGLDCIVTRNTNDFRGTYISVYSPDKFMELI